MRHSQTNPLDIAIYALHCATHDWIKINTVPLSQRCYFRCVKAVVYDTDNATSVNIDALLLHSILLSP